MAIYLTMDLPVTRAVIEAISKAMDVNDDPPAGLIAHVAVDLPDGDGIRIVDIWDTREDFDRFRETQLDPTLHKMLPELGIQLDGPPPDPEFFDAYDVVRGSA
jgi:hypothetical protein